MERTLRDIFEEQKVKNDVITEESYPSLKNKYYFNSKPKQVGDVPLYAFLAKNKTLTNYELIVLKEDYINEITLVLDVLDSCVPIVTVKK